MTGKTDKTKQVLEHAVQHSFQADAELRAIALQTAVKLAPNNRDALKDARQFYDFLIAR